MKQKGRFFSNRPQFEKNRPLCFINQAMTS